MTDSTTNYPKLRNIEAHPYRHEGQDMVLLRDTECITENSLLVPKQTIYIISMMDGTRTPRDIQAEYMRATGDLIYIEQIENLIDIMDKKKGKKRRDQPMTVNKQFGDHRTKPHGV